MRRQIAFVALVVFTFSLLIFITATLAAPDDAPRLQTTEVEPNDTPAEANPIALNVQVQGDITQTVGTLDTDYFALSTQPGARYVADLTVLTPNGMKLQLRVLDSNEGVLEVSSASNASVQLDWTSPGGVNYIQIRKSDIPSITVTTDYQMEISIFSATPTPTPPNPWDAYEPNDSFSEVYALPIDTSVELQSLDGLANFQPYSGRFGPDEDWYAFYTRAGFTYQVSTEDLSNSDTVVEIYHRDDDVTPVVSDDNSGGGFSSLVQWEAAYDGYYYIRVINDVDTTGSYDMVVLEIAGMETPTPGPSPTPGPGPDPRADTCENNFDFENACIIPTDQTRTFNFVSPDGGPDNDFYRVWVKSGLIYECATSDLDPGVDPNMILFSGPSWDQAIGGNDDRERGDFNSYFSYYSTYDGWLYVLVGYGKRTPPDIYNSEYSLRCSVTVPGVATATPSDPTRTPPPTSPPGATPTTPASPLPTPTPEPEEADIIIRPLVTPTPPAAPATPALHFIPVDLVVYYDANQDGQSGAGEGIAGLLVIAYDTATGQEIAQGFTDELGHLEFTAAVQGVVRLSIPYLGISHVVGEDSDTIYVRIAPGSGF